MRSRITTTLTRAPLPIKLALGVLLLALAAFGYWTIAPLFVTTRVDEAFPAVAVQATSLPAVPTSLPPTVAAPTALPVAAAATPEPAATSVPTVAVAPTIAPASAEPIVLARGRFTQIDRLHGADGMAVIYQLPAGQRVLRFEGFDAKNGPDLRVSLAGHAQPRSRAEAHDQGYIELALLTATQGNQNYALPADLDLGAYKSVVIYCQAFHVVFSTATLE